jgi:hypothetical protein
MPTSGEKGLRVSVGLKLWSLLWGEGIPPVCAYVTGSRELRSSLLSPSLTLSNISTPLTTSTKERRWGVVTSTAAETRKS